MKPDLVIGVGELLFDVFPTGRKLGGAPVNFAWHVGQLGLPCFAVSAVGRDELGEEILSLLRERGIPHCVPSVGAPTGTVQVTLDGSGIPTFTILENVAWDRIPFSEELSQAARRCASLCFGTLAQRSPVSRQTIRRLIGEIPPENGALLVCDINLRQHFYSRMLVEESLEICNILKINDDELLVIAGLLDCPVIGAEPVSRWLMERYALKTVILTCGAVGSYVFTPEETSWEPTPKVEVVDTVGAGDSFTAVYCADILKGRSVREAHRHAVAVSAFVCTQAGAMPVLPENLRG